jgi:hypothetical protein
VTTSAKRQSRAFIDTAYNTEDARRSVLGHKPPAEFEAELKAGCADATPGRSAVTQLAFLTDGAQSQRSLSITDSDRCRRAL